MQLGEVKTRAIKLINEYSNNGNLISAAVNADYTLRLNELADYCQNEISDKVGIEATYTIDGNTATDGSTNLYKKYDLPADYKEHRFVRWDDEPFFEYRMEDRQFWIDNFLGGTFTLGYYRYPTTIDSETPDTYEFEVDAYTQGIIPYYLGGMVIADENPGISDKLLNIYYERLGQLYKRNLRSPKTVRKMTRWWR